MKLENIIQYFFCCANWVAKKDYKKQRKFLQNLNKMDNMYNVTLHVDNK